MKKVLYYSPMPDDPTSFYRIRGVLPFIKHGDIELIDISNVQDFSWETFIGADILILQRPCTKSHVHMISLAKEQGVKVITDYDDDLTCVDIYNPMHDFYTRVQPELNGCVKLSDEVWVSTASIKKSLDRFNKNIKVIPNAHNNYLFPVEAKKPFNTKTKIVAWRGGSSHEADVYEVADKLVETINNNPDWTFNFFGERFTYMELRCGNNYNSISPMSLIQFYKYFHNMNPNIVISPLRDTKFNQGKSNIAFIEGVYAGAVVVSNRNLPEFDIPYLGNIDDWIKEKFSDFIVEEMAQINNELWDYIVKNLLLSNINKLRIQSMLEL